MSGREEYTSERVAELTQALEASEARFHNVVTQSLDGLIIVDQGGLIRFANPAAAAFFGRTQADLIGEEFGFPLVSGETTELDLLRKGGVVTVEVRVGDSRWDGRAVSLLSMRDITEKRRRENELRKMSRAVLESPNMVIITDRHGEIEFVNPKFHQVTGYSLPEVAGKKPLLLSSKPEPEDQFRKLREAIRTGREWRGELVSRKKNGELYWQSVAISPIADAEGNITNFIEVMEDITERKQAGEKIEKLNAELAARAADLEAANRELEAFNYTVAHDLRKPLTVISSYCQAIKEQGFDKLDGSCQEYLQEIYQGTLRMHLLIEALINFSRMARVELKREPISLTILAQEIALELQLADPGRQGRFHIREELTADGDANLLRVVLNNLLGNAWKFTAHRQEAIIEFGRTEVMGKPTWYVRDNGYGFDMRDVDQLFLPFRRLPGTESFQGFGIGLATVERIIHRHGGRIWAEGEPDQGATFFFSLAAE